MITIHKQEINATVIGFILFICIIPLPIIPVKSATGTINWEEYNWNTDYHSTSQISTTYFDSRSDVLWFQKWDHLHAQALKSQNLDLGNTFTVLVDYFPQGVYSWSWGATFKIIWQGGGIAWIKDQSDSYTEWGMTGQSSIQQYNKISDGKWYQLKITSTSSKIIISYDDLSDSSGYFELMNANKDSSMTGPITISLGTDRVDDYSTYYLRESYYYDNLRPLKDIIEPDLSSYRIFVEEYPIYYTRPTGLSPLIQSDDYGMWYTLPFAVPLFGTPIHSVYICSNGYLLTDRQSGIVNGNCEYSNTNLGLQTKYMIAPFWDDLRTDLAGGIATDPGVYVWNDGSSRITFEWVATRFGAPSDSFKFQVSLRVNGDHRFSYGDATNRQNFSPTIGMSNLRPDWILNPKNIWNLISDPYWESNLNSLFLDSGPTDEFFWDRGPGIPILHPPTNRLLQSTGWSPECNSDPITCMEVHGGPPGSRNYVPDELTFSFQINDPKYFFTTLKYSSDVWTPMQSAAGYSLVYLIEYMVPKDRVAGTGFPITLSNLPGHIWHYAECNGYYGGVRNCEIDVHLFNPLLIQANTQYFASVYVDMLPGYTAEYNIAQESEVYADPFPWEGTVFNQRDWYKQYIGQYWWDDRGVGRFGCGPSYLPLEIKNTNNLTSLSVSSPDEGPFDDFVKIKRWQNIKTKQDLSAYINLRQKEGNQVMKTLKDEELTEIVVTFNTGIDPEKFIEYANNMKLNINQYGLKGDQSITGQITVSENFPFTFDSYSYLVNKVNGQNLKVTDFFGHLNKNQIKDLNKYFDIQLVDFVEDQETLKIKGDYSQLGYGLITVPMFSLTYYNSLISNEVY